MALHHQYDSSGVESSPETCHPPSPPINEVGAIKTFVHSSRSSQQWNSQRVHQQQRQEQQNDYPKIITFSNDELDQPTQSTTHHQRRRESNISNNDNLTSSAGGLDDIIVEDDDVGIGGTGSGDRSDFDSEFERIYNLPLDEASYYEEKKQNERNGETLVQVALSQSTRQQEQQQLQHQSSPKNYIHRTSSGYHHNHQQQARRVSESSSVDLNAYSGRRTEDSATNINDRVVTAEEKQRMKELNQQSIFRPQQQHDNKVHPSAGDDDKVQTDGNTSAKKESTQLLSPTVVMERRRTSSRPRPTQLQLLATTNSTPSSETTRSRSRSTSILRNGGSPTNIITPSSRTRSMSRTPSSVSNLTNGSKRRSRSSANTSRHRSRSRSTTSCRRLSKSTSKELDFGSNVKTDDYHSSLFRGAALIREQLLRSMASVDQAMDEADREFMEEMIERGRVGREDAGRNDEFEEDVDFDYCKGYVHPLQTAASSLKHATAGSVNKSNHVVRFAPSQDSTTDSELLETESRRLDNLVRILAANSSSSSMPSVVVEERSSSDKENEEDESVQPRQVESDVISPTSSLGLNSPTSQGVLSQSNNASNGCYAQQYFKEDSPKNIVDFSVPPPPNSKHTPSPRPQQDSPANEALNHANRAGPLWRSLVGNHVRFPTQWDSILPPSSPPIVHPHSKWSKWYYVARHRVKGDRRLNSRENGVRSRRSGGRILMRLVVRNTHSQQICREVAVGCFHPNAKGIRADDPLAEQEDVREVWMAVRWLIDEDESEPTIVLTEDDYEGVIDAFLTQKRRLEYRSMGSALGHKRQVNNENVRAVFGDEQPLKTIDLYEDELAEILQANCERKLAVLPALMLLKLFLFAK